MVFRAVCLSSLVSLLSCASPSPPSTTAPEKSASPTLTYLGVAGWELDADGRTLLMDPYFSRRDAKDGVPLAPDDAVIAQHTPPHADGILVSHSHYDHLLDVPAVAKLTGASVVGTESTLNVARASAIAESRLVLAHGGPGESILLGPFTVHPVRALHSLTGQPTVTISRGIILPMPSAGWGEGGTLQYLVKVDGRTILFMGTANFVETEVTGLRPDIAIVAVGLREKVPDYSCRLMRALGNPKLVLTNHFDAHRKPLGPKQMDIGDDGRADLSHFADEIHACSPATKVIVPKHFEPMTI